MQVIIIKTCLSLFIYVYWDSNTAISSSKKKNAAAKKKRNVKGILIIIIYYKFFPMKF